nr:histidine-rich glycoprotein [Drosophila suzukii]
MALRFVVVISAWLVLAQGSFLHGSLNEAHQSDIVGAEAEVPQEGYLPAEDVIEPHSLHHESEGVGHHHHGGHNFQSQSHHHEHGPHHHLESHHHLSESHHHHHLSESHHLIHGSPHHHHHLEAPHHGAHHHHHLEATHHGIHGSHGVHHVHHHRNCHATIHCPSYHSPTYATDGHLCYKVENSCELAILNCLRRNELKPLLRHISGHECHHLPSAHRSHRAH